MSRFLLDTGVVSLPMKPRPPSRLLSKLLSIEPASSISSVTVAELRYGWYRLAAGAKREQLGHFLDEIIPERFPVLPFDRAAAEWHAAERARLAGLGTPAPYADGQIAAIAAANDLTLVTLNGQDFAAFEGLRVEAWPAVE